MRRPLRRSFLDDHRPRLPGGQPPRWSGRPRVLFAIAGRTGAQRFNGAGQRRGDPGPDPLGERPLGHAPRAPGGVISLSTCVLAAVPSVIARRCPERLTARRPVLLAARMLARNKFLYSFSRPACGRPAAALGRHKGGRRCVVRDAPLVLDHSGTDYSNPRGYFHSFSRPA
jgi:hypothetical protein